MAFNKTGFHIAANCGGCGGIADYRKTLADAGVPFTVYAVDDFGQITGSLKYSTATLVYRDAEASTVNPADYGNPAEQMASVYWQRTKDRLPAQIIDNRNRVWIELLNEPGREPEQAEWVGALMFGMALLALRDGYRICGPGWASGNPEPEAWEGKAWQRYLALCGDEPERVAVSLHEYSLDNDIHHGEGWLVGRFRQVHAACDRHGLPRPVIFITECGWTLNSMPPDEQAKRDIRWLDDLYGQHPNIRCAALWTLQSGKGNGDLPQRLGSLIPWMTEYSMERYDGQPDVEPPQETGKDVLSNGSFEEGWSDADTFPGQHPNGWEVAWNLTGGDSYPNPYSGQSYLLGEGVHKSKAMLPVEEREVFVRDGEWTYKAFAKDRCIWFRLKQSVSLPAGRYLLRTGVWVDCYKWDAVNKRKDYNVEPRQCEMLVKVNGEEVAPWLALKSGMFHSTETLIDHKGGMMNLAVHYRCNWAIPNNLWLDDWSLVPVGTPEPEPEPVGFEQAIWQAAMSVAPSNTDAALQKAILASNRFYPFGPEKWTSYGGNKYATQAAVDWDSDEKRAYWCQVPNWNEIEYVDDPATELVFANWPVADAPVITQPFGARPEYYSTFGFPGHEGVDIRCRDGSPVKAVADGVVLNRTTTGNYGNAIRIRHKAGWTTVYAHLKSFAAVDAGDLVRAGQTIGFGGQTGNATGVHLHLTLSSETQTWTDAAGNRWPKGIHDPTPYLSRFLSGSRIDTLPHLNGDGRIYQMTVIRQGQQHSQQMQTQRDADWFYHVKNSEWEQLAYDGEYIYRAIDTSPGDGMYYRQRENTLAAKARWSPRLWVPGDIYERNPLVIFYDKSSGVQLAKPEPGYRRSWLKFAAHYNLWAHPRNPSISFRDVVEYHWLLKPDAVSPAETYFYAAGYGLVGWQSSHGDYSFVSEIFDAGERSPAEREKIIVR